LIVKSSSSINRVDTSGLAPHSFFSPFNIPWIQLVSARAYSQCRKPRFFVQVSKDIERTLTSLPLPRFRQLGDASDTGTRRMQKTSEILKISEVSLISRRD
jgi:hypothetical protein